MDAKDCWNENQAENLKTAVFRLKVIVKRWFRRRLFRGWLKWRTFVQQETLENQLSKLRQREEIQIGKSLMKKSSFRGLNIVEQCSNEFEAKKHGLLIVKFTVEFGRNLARMDQKGIPPLRSTSLWTTRGIKGIRGIKGKKGLKV